MSFKDIALPLAARGVRVIPCQPLAKHTFLRGGPERGTLDEKQILAWDKENPNYNVGSLGTLDGVCLFDCDAKGLVAQIEKETGHKMPPTFTVKSANKGTAHLYFAQTDFSRALGNKTHRAGELRGNNEYVVGPGSEIVCDDGTKRKYEIYRDVPFAPFPDFLGDWVLENFRQKKSASTGAVDADAFAKLKAVYLSNLNPNDLFGRKDIPVITSLHPTLRDFAGLLHDGERTPEEIEEILTRVGSEYGHRQPLPKDTIDVANWLAHREPCELCLNEGHPALTPYKINGLHLFQTADAYKTWVAENIDNLDVKVKPQDNASTVEWFFPAHKLADQVLPEQRVFVHTADGTPVLRASFLMELFAFRGVGKSAVAMGLTKLLLRGGKFLDYHSAGGVKVLYADGELPLILLQDRIKTFIGEDIENLWFMSAEELPGQVFPALIDPAIQRMFIENLEQIKPDVIVLDTLSAVGKFDTNDADAWRVFNNFLLQLRFKGYCVIVVHHAGKNGTQRGRTDAEDNMDLVIQLTPPDGHDPGDGLKVFFNYTKVRYGGRLQNFACEYVDGSWRMLVDSEEKEIVEMLNTGRSLKGVSMQLGVTIARVRTVKKKAKAKGLILTPAELSKKRPLKTAADLEQEQLIREVLS